MRKKEIIVIKLNRKDKKQKNANLILNIKELENNKLYRREFHEKN